MGRKAGKKASYETAMTLAMADLLPRVFLLLFGIIDIGFAEMRVDQLGCPAWTDFWPEWALSGWLILPLTFAVDAALNVCVPVLLLRLRRRGEAARLSTLLVLLVLCPVNLLITICSVWWGAGYVFPSAASSVIELIAYELYFALGVFHTLTVIWLLTDRALDKLLRGANARRRGCLRAASAWTLIALIVAGMLLPDGLYGTVNRRPWTPVMRASVVIDNQDDAQSGNSLVLEWDAERNAHEVGQEKAPTRSQVWTVKSRSWFLAGNQSAQNYTLAYKNQTERQATETEARMIELAARVTEHMIMETHLFRADGYRFIQIALNVNLWAPWELYVYDEARDRLVHVCQCDHRYVTALEILDRDWFEELLASPGPESKVDG